jgi:hypothetical protein
MSIYDQYNDKMHELYEEYATKSVEERIEYLASFSYRVHHVFFPDIPQPSMEVCRASMRRCFEYIDQIERQAGGD